MKETDPNEASELLPALGKSSHKYQSGRKSLSEEQAIEIFKRKRDQSSRMSSVSSALAKQYGVSSKCIRDIWHGRTWPEATFHLWNSEDKMSEDFDGKMEKVIANHNC